MKLGENSRSIRAANASRWVLNDIRKSTSRVPALRHNGAADFSVFSAAGVSRIIKCDSNMNAIVLSATLRGIPKGRDRHKCGCASAITGAPDGLELGRGRGIEHRRFRTMRSHVGVQRAASGEEALLLRLVRPRDQSHVPNVAGCSGSELSICPRRAASREILVLTTSSRQPAGGPAPYNCHCNGKCRRDAQAKHFPSRAPVRDSGKGGAGLAQKGSSADSAARVQDGSNRRAVCDAA